MGYTFAASGSLPVSRVQGFVISKSTSVSDQRKAKMKDVPARNAELGKSRHYVRRPKRIAAFFVTFYHDFRTKF